MMSPTARDEAVAALAGTELDVVVIGGGVVGAGCALDATTRGLSTGLLEMRDFASGTSSRSSKLIHGGLRYLEMLDFRLVREALRERNLLLRRLAPHLVRPVQFLYPLTHPVWERGYVGAGVTLYDTMAGRGADALPHHRQLTRRGALRVCPALRPDSFVGAIQYWDAQVDDARHTMFVVRTAAAHGAHVLSRAQVIGFLREGGRITGVRVRDLEHDCEFEVRARQVVNATGVWTDDTQAMIGERGQFRVRASKGIHLVVPRDRIRSAAGMILRTAISVLFVIPWGRHWIVGTTDTDWTLDKAHPAATRTDIDYLLREVNTVLATPLRRDDVEGIYAGLRPLLAGESELTSKLSREHLVATPVPGLVAVAGGKYTTYRVMAADAVDAAVHNLGGAVPRSCTDEVPLVGADGFAALWNRRTTLAAASGLHVARVEHLLGRHGSLVPEVLDLIRAEPGLAQPVPGADDYLLAEVRYAVEAEGARHVEDVLTRRTRISIETFDRGMTAVRPVATLMAGTLGWTAEQIDREVDHYRLRVEAERASQDQPDDRTAELIRREAPDVVPVVHAS
ncbi:glycerol-3-phosphate dehydrogenase/oxidase [Dactylosporangium sp. CA-233914]|uniref:glycerol-3-phosphate dehydrogenase/oxidase n=1 Tax=Dactylosporangium sp. CA-233914 TaxID=3239934 RepID=UPI003D8AEF7F